MALGRIPVLVLVCSQTQSLLTQAGLELIMWPRMTSDPPASSPPEHWDMGVHYRALFIQG